MRQKYFAMKDMNEHMLKQLEKSQVRCTQLKNRKPSRGTHLIHFLDLKRICFHRLFILKSLKRLG